METDQATNYMRIEKAIEYICVHHKQQPSLEEIAAVVHLSPFHFQRMFTRWAGVSPKKFMQFLTIEYAKQQLKQHLLSVNETALNAGLSGTGRLHDLFVNIEGMTPGDYKNGGAGLKVNYAYSSTPFGSVLIASTQKGVCHIAFESDGNDGLSDLKALHPNAMYTNNEDQFQKDALIIFKEDWSDLTTIQLHLKGTAFQLQVWKSLLSIPLGGLASYGDIAKIIDKPNASRAVGSAIGRNPVAFLIPCHRVIQGNGKTGNYMWGATRKSAIIGWEGLFIEGNK